MSTVLSNLLLPGENAGAASSLYYKAQGKTNLFTDRLELEPGACVDFSTYFNALFYAKYAEHCKIDRVRLVLNCSGSYKVRISCGDTATASVLWETENSPENVRLVSPWIELSAMPENSALSFELSANDAPASFIGGCWETDSDRVNEIKVAAVICTYRREEYVLRNIAEINRKVIENPVSAIHNNLDLIVVDNGNSLKKENSGRLRVCHNKNLGGSGGFTRGIIEAYESGEYSHVLLMDDDISFEPDVLLRTVQFLKLAKETECPICVGGQMLIEDEPTVQFESGAYYCKGRLVPINQGLELSNWDNLFLNDVDRDAAYHAWWYCCFPLSQVERIGLPLPLFIKTDDIEYGLRNKFKIVNLNGIGIWHSAFDGKYSIHLEYYIKRNELIVSALHREGDGLTSCLWKLIRASMKALLIGNTLAVNFLLKAYCDFLQGPDFFLNTDAERLNHELIEMKKAKRPGRAAAIIAYPFHVFPVLFQYILRSRGVQRSYRERIGEITSFEFWHKVLEI